MFGLSSIRHSVARSGVSANTAFARALSTAESLKVSVTKTPAMQKEERIKYFKIYRWDPDHRQKPVSQVNVLVFLSTPSAFPCILKKMDIFGLLSVLFPVPLHLSRGPQRLRPDGPRCPNQNQIRAGSHAYLSSILSRGDLRIVRDEHQRTEYSRLPVLHRTEGGEKIERRRDQDLSPAPYVCVEGFGPRHG